MRFQFKLLIFIALGSLLVYTAYTLFAPRHFADEFVVTSYLGEEIETRLDITLRRRVTFSSRLHGSIFLNGVEYVSALDIFEAGAVYLNGILPEGTFIPVAYIESHATGIIQAEEVPQVQIELSGGNLRPNFDFAIITVNQTQIYLRK